MELARKLNINELIIYYDYEGIRNWALNIWKANKDISKDYISFVKKLNDLGMRFIFRHVKGHSGILGNDIADKLAREAVKL